MIRIYVTELSTPFIENHQLIHSNLIIETLVTCVDSNIAHLDLPLV